MGWSGCEAEKPMAKSERRAVTVLLTEEHLRKMIEDHLLKEDEIGDRVKVARIVQKLLDTSGLIHSDDSQIGRSSSSSLYESRHCRDCHPNGSPSTRGDRRGPQRAAEACMARPHHPGDGRGLRYR